MNSAFEVSAVTDIAFWVASVMAIGAALLVVTLSNVFRAAVALTGSFLGVACIFFLLSAEFIGVVQILVYVGAISILIAFAVLMLHDVRQGSRPSRGRVLAATVSALFLASIAFVGYNTDWSSVDDLSNENAIAGLAGTFSEREIEGETGPVRIVEKATADDPQVQTGVLVDSTGAIGALLIDEFVLPFETLGLIIIATLIGGLVLMRPSTPEQPDDSAGDSE